VENILKQFQSVRKSLENLS